MVCRQVRLASEVSRVKPYEAHPTWSTQFVVLTRGGGLHHSNTNLGVLGGRRLDEPALLVARIRPQRDVPAAGRVDQHEEVGRLARGGGPRATRRSGRAPPPRRPTRTGRVVIISRAPFRGVARARCTRRPRRSRGRQRALLRGGARRPARSAGESRTRVPGASAAGSRGTCGARRRSARRARRRSAPRVGSNANTTRLQRRGLAPCRSCSTARAHSASPSRPSVASISVLLCDARGRSTR